MSKPNKAFAAARKQVGFSAEHVARVEAAKAQRAAADPFMTWFFDRVQNHGETFASMQEARARFDASRTA